MSFLAKMHNKYGIRSDRNKVRAANDHVKLYRTLLEAIQDEYEDLIVSGAIEDLIDQLCEAVEEQREPSPP